MVATCSGALLILIFISSSSAFLLPGLAPSRPQCKTTALLLQRFSSHAQNTAVWKPTMSANSIALAPVHWRHMSVGVAPKTSSLRWDVQSGSVLHDLPRIETPPARRSCGDKSNSSGGRLGRPMHNQRKRRISSSERSSERSRRKKELEVKAMDLQISMAVAKQHLMDSVSDVITFQPRHISNAMTLGAVFSLTALVVFSLPFVLGMPFLEMLLSHGCAGALGGLAALFGDAALSASLDKPRLGYWRWREDNCVATFLKGCVRRWKINLREHCITRMAVTRSVNAMTFVFIKHLASLSLGPGVQPVVIAAAGTGVVATAVQTALCKSQETLFQDTVLSNMLMFEGFWVTYAALGTLLPACGITYCGLAISGALGGLGMVLADFSWQAPKGTAGLREGLERFREKCSDFSKRDAINGKKFRAAFQMSILNVVYMMVFWQLQ